MNRQSRARLLVAGCRAGWGAVLVLQPHPVVRAASGRTPTEAARTVARILGARHLLQALASLRWSSATARDLGLATDMLHALTGLGFAALPTTWRRAALLDASLASGFAAAGTAASAGPTRS